MRLFSSMKMARKRGFKSQACDEPRGVVEEDAPIAGGEVHVGPGGGGWRGGNTENPVSKEDDCGCES